MAAYLLKDDDGSKSAIIERENHFMVADCRAAMIRQYLQTGEVSWEFVLSSLKKANYINLVEDIRAAEKL